MIASDGKDRDAGNEQDQKRREDDRPRAELVVQPAAEQRARGAGDGEQDSEHAKLDRAPAERPRRIDSAEREQRHQSVGVDHVRKQERADVLVLPCFAQRLQRSAKSRAECRPEFQCAFSVRREQHHRRHEHNEPECGQRTHGAVAFARHCIQSERGRRTEQRQPRMRIGREKQKRERQRNKAAEIARRPAQPRQPADFMRRHEIGHHRVVEHGRELDADGGNRECDQNNKDRALAAGRAEPQSERTKNEERAERRDPWLAPSGCIRDRADERRSERDHDARGRGRKSPQRLPARGIAGDGGSEIRRVDEGGNQREERLARPVEQHPAENRAARRFSHGSMIPKIPGG